MSLGKQITKYRKQYNLTQEKLADILNVSRQTIARWEGDMSVPDITKINKMCELFNVSIDELLETKLEDENINNQQIVSLIESINKSTIKMNRQHYLMMVMSIIIVGAMVILISLYSFLNNERNQLKIKGIESQMNDLTYQMQSQQEILTDLMSSLERFNDDTLVKDYRISFSDMNDTSTNIQIKTWLSSYKEDASVYFNIEDVEGRQYVLDAHLENDYFICNPYTIDNKDIRKVSIVLNSNGELVQDTIIKDLDTTSYTRFNDLYIYFDELNMGANIENYSTTIVVDDSNSSLNENIETTLSIKEVKFKLIVNDRLVYDNKMQTVNDDFGYNKRFEIKDFTYPLKKTDKIQIEITIEDSTGKKHSFISDECFMRYGQINMNDVYFSKIEE